MEEGFLESSAVEDSDFILDRLCGLEKLIPQELLNQVLEECGLHLQKACVLSHRVMLWVVLAMGLLTHLPIRQVFKHARRMHFLEKTPARSSLCEGRKRLGVEPVRALYQKVVHPLATPDTPGAFYRGLRLMAIDGSVYDAPDTAANALRFDRADGGRGEGAFPQVRKVSLVEVGTHIEIALVVGGWQDNEVPLSRQLYEHLPNDSLLMADCAFYCVEDWKTLDKKGIKLLFRIGATPVFEPTQSLADGSYLSMMYDRSDDRQRQRNGTVVRIIEYTLDDPQRTGHGERHRLITNLLDAEQYPALELVCLYHERWEIELVFDEQKTHQDPRRPGKPAHFRSETPTGVEQEIYALSLGHFVVRAMMLEAATQEDLDVDRLSFTGCLRILQARLPECASSHPVCLAIWYRCLLAELGQEQIEPRRNRINPRVVKRKMSKFAKKRPHHRNQPPLRKPFIETVLIE